MTPESWYLVGAPWDCSGAHRGEEAAPAALRAAGVRALVGRDLGDAATLIDGAERDEETGVLALPASIRSARSLTGALDDALGELPELRPLVVGGDCSLLLGVVPALRRRFGPIGLAVLDGHPDYLDGHTSETGETADMALAALTGAAAPALVTLDGPPPVVVPDDVVLLGHREVGLDPASAAELAGVPQNLRRIDAAEVTRDPAAAGRQAVAHLESRERRWWVHVDLDVLDPGALSAVTYPQGAGLGWEHLGEVLRELTHGSRLLGVSLADFRPDLDPTGEQAERVLDLLDRSLP